MYSPLQKKALAPYLKSLEDQRNVLQPMLENTTKAIDECKLWITEKDGSKKVFGEIMQQLEEINYSNLKTYSFLLRKFQRDGDDETHLDKSSSPTFDQLHNLLQKVDSIDTKTELLEQKCLHFEENFNTLNNNQKSFEIKQESYMKKSKSLERLIFEMEENMKALTERMEAQTELLTTHSDQTKQNTSSLNEIKKLISSDHKQIQETEKNVQTLVRKSNDNEATVNAMSEKQLQITSNLKKMELKYGLLCQVLAKRYSVFDYVKDGLSKFYLSREDTFLKFDDRISALEESNNTSFVGFCVDVQTCDYNPKSGEIISQFSVEYFNIGGHFNTSTGEFTVPTDGVYCVGFTVYGDTDSDSAIALILRQRNNESSPDNQATCFDENDDNLITPSDSDDINLHNLDIQSYPQHFLAVETFSEGDKLFLEYHTTGENIGMPRYSSFTCYKIHDCNNERETESETSEN